MGEFIKMGIALVAMCCFLGCAAQQIQCRDAEGKIAYEGRYDQETPGAYIVEPNAYTRDFWPKPACQKKQGTPPPDRVDLASSSRIVHTAPV